MQRKKTNAGERLMQFFQTPQSTNLYEEKNEMNKSESISAERKKLLIHHVCETSPGCRRGACRCSCCSFYRRTQA